jgi:hypothetical protein
MRKPLFLDIDDLRLRRFTGTEWLQHNEDHIPDKRIKPRMSCEDWLQLKRDKWLSAYIVEAARSMARKNEELFEDLVQEAWLRIDLFASGLKLEFYAHEAFKAMDNYYRREVRQWRLTRKCWSREPVHKRPYDLYRKYYPKQPTNKKAG